MAVKFIDAVRINPAPCNHYKLTFEVDDATQRSKDITLDQLDSILDDLAAVIGEGPRAHEIALGILWTGYQLRKGSTIPQMRNQTIVDAL